MRISKDLAHQVAVKLTEKSRLAVEAVLKEYRELVTDFYWSQTPKDVKDCFAANKDWFNTRSRIDFTGHGFNYESITSDMPVICNSGSSAHLHLTAKIADQIVKAKRKYDKAQAEYKALQKESETAILNLRTYARVKEHIPLAAPLLPPPMSNALVVNFDSLNKRIQRQPEPPKNATVSKVTA